MRKCLFWLLVVLVGYSCAHTSPPQPYLNWQNLDLQKDGVFGISTEKAYEQLLKNKTATTTVVAVIDSGIDTTQQDLKPVLWTDPTDGSHGRNYIGPETGKEDFIPMMANTVGDSSYHRILDDYNLHVTRLQTFISQLKESQKVLEQIVKNIGKENPSLEDLKNYRPRNESETGVIGLVLDRMPLYPDFERLRYYEVDHLLYLGEYHLEHALNRTTFSKADTSISHNSKTDGVDINVSNDPLGLVADPNVMPFHGTHMAGIIAAVRNNGQGINGVSDHARILVIKLFNNIREMRNSDLAAAIRYAADHGARIINMSFGKVFSLHRALVDSAVKYAMAKDVLIIHSAGNDRMNLDSNSFFPSPKYLDGSIAPAWLTVGASGYRDDSSLPATFSNYGRHTVDVYGPGVQITSTIPNSGTVAWDGTSVVAPVVAGLAALIRSYYPQLTAAQVKDIIVRSVVKRKALEDKCISGGVVNAYNALKLAANETMPK
jgi:subtilisin family serine protease